MISLPIPLLARSTAGAAILFALGAGPLGAQTQSGSSKESADKAIYKCESESGAPTYQNAPGKNCRKLDLQPLTTFTAPALPAKTAQARGGAAAREGARENNGARVDSATQRARDSDRRRIIEDELKREEAKLESLRSSYNGGEPERLAGERNYQTYLDRVAQMKEEIERSESTVASLKRELASIRD